MRLACKTFDILIYYYKLAKISCCYVRAHYTANCHMQAEYDFVQWEDVRLKIKVWSATWEWFELFASRPNPKRYPKIPFLIEN